jgi:NAD+ synthase
METDNKKIINQLTEFISSEFGKAGFSKGVIGLSGGIDSAVSAYVSTLALGKENLHFVLMPYKTSSRDSVTDAMKVVDSLGVSYSIIEITPMVDAYISNYAKDGLSDVRKGNIMARMRMIVLYDVSAERNALVIGTGNKTEILLGYTTIYGDSACAINPLGDLYKTQVRNLAKYLKVPESILIKKPSADLWEGQTDESEMDLTYEEADRYFYNKYDMMYSKERLIEMGFSEKFMKKIDNIVEKNRFKSLLPPIARIK